MKKTKHQGVHNKNQEKKEVRDTRVPRQTETIKMSGGFNDHLGFTNRSRGRMEDTRF